MIINKENGRKMGRKKKNGTNKQTSRVIRCSEIKKMSLEYFKLKMNGVGNG